MRALLLPVAIVGLLSACAGSPPDYSQRTKSASVKQDQLSEWLATQGASNAVAAPVCSSTAGHPSSGWAIEDDNWCVVACPQRASVSNQWMQTSDGLRCFSTTQPANAIVNTEFQIQHWQLDQVALFTGIERSFVSDTEWNCTEQVYQIDPNTRRGFWVDKSPGNSYRFYNDGALMVARPGAPMQLAGGWHTEQGSGVVAKDELLFQYAVHYGGSRFDEFESATSKQLCRFVDHPPPRG